MKAKLPRPTSASSASEWPDISASGGESADSQMIWPHLFAHAGSLQTDQLERLPWQPFRPGVEIHRLYGGQQGPAAALLKYAAGASVPDHDHSGYEHILVLSGAQRDQRGSYEAGTFVVNPPGSSHAVESDQGCVVLIIWEKPVVIREGMP